jgi:hypothetical protein
MDGDLVRGLRSRGVDVVTAADARMIRRKMVADTLGRRGRKWEVHWDGRFRTDSVLQAGQKEIT